MCNGNVDINFDLTYASVNPRATHFEACHNLLWDWFFFRSKNNADINSNNFKVHRRRKKKNSIQPSTWLNEVYLGLIENFKEDPQLDPTSGKDPSLDLTSEEQKAPCADIGKTPHWKVPHGKNKIHVEARRDRATEENMEDGVCTAHTHGRTST